MDWVVYLSTGAVALLLVPQVLVAVRAKRSVGRAAPDTAAVDRGAQGTEPRVYYFHAAHCGHCHAMTPPVDRLAATHGNLIKVDVAERPDLARGFGIAATPSFVRVEGGKVRTVRLGCLGERQLLALLAAG